ncbi:MAG: capsular exopolysaccharide family [Frankiales bacterium]|nr:capsular exopolysaccharide family [Frankiales bacterium]
MAEHAEVRMLRRNALPVLACAVLGAATGYGYVQRAQPSFQSTVVLFVSATQTPSGGGEYDRARFAQERVVSYVPLVVSPPVLQPVINELHLDDSPADLAHRLTVTAAPGTVLLRISAQADDAAGAMRTANATATSFASFVGRLEGTDDGNPSVDLLVTQSASLDAEQVSPRPRLDVGLGLFFGLLVGLVAATLRQRWTVADAPLETSPLGVAAVPAADDDEDVRIAQNGSALDASRRSPRRPAGLSGPSPHRSGWS